MSHLQELTFLGMCCFYVFGHVNFPHLKNLYSFEVYAS